MLEVRRLSGVERALPPAGRVGPQLAGHRPRSTAARELFRGAGPGRPGRPHRRLAHAGRRRPRPAGPAARASTWTTWSIVPVATAMKMLNRRSLFRLVLQVRSHADLDRAKERAVRLIAERHGEEDVTAITQDAVLGAFTSILGALTLALAGIASVSLAVAGVGIMNVMLVSVSERTREIGLLKALGAGRRQILLAFLAEAVLISTAGGVLGLAVGWLAVRGLVFLYPALPGFAAGVGGRRGLLPLGGGRRRLRRPARPACDAARPRGRARGEVSPCASCCASPPGALRAHRLRSFLSMLGIAIGVAAVILLTSIGEGTRVYMVAQFTQFGTNLLAVNPGKSKTIGIPGVARRHDAQADDRRRGGPRADLRRRDGRARHDGPRSGPGGRARPQRQRPRSDARPAQPLWRFGARQGSFWPRGDPRRSAPLRRPRPQARARALRRAEPPRGARADRGRRASASSG